MKIEIYDDGLYVVTDNKRKTVAIFDQLPSFCGGACIQMDFNTPALNQESFFKEFINGLDSVLERCTTYYDSDVNYKTLLFISEEPFDKILQEQSGLDLIVIDDYSFFYNRSYCYEYCDDEDDEYYDDDED